jgi:hypothetical protein
MPRPFEPSYAYIAQEAVYATVLGFAQARVDAGRLVLSLLRAEVELSKRRLLRFGSINAGEQNSLLFLQEITDVCRSIMRYHGFGQCCVQTQCGLEGSDRIQFSTSVGV